MRRRRWRTHLGQGWWRGRPAETRPGRDRGQRAGPGGDQARQLRSGQGLGATRVTRVLSGAPSARPGGRSADVRAEPSGPLGPSVAAAPHLGLKSWKRPLRFMAENFQAAASPAPPPPAACASAWGHGARAARGPASVPPAPSPSPSPRSRVRAPSAPPPGLP